MWQQLCRRTLLQRTVVPTRSVLLRSHPVPLGKSWSSTSSDGPPTQGTEGDPAFEGKYVIEGNILPINESTDTAGDGDDVEARLSWRLRRKASSAALENEGPQ